jgi:hypothetical protein
MGSSSGSVLNTIPGAMAYEGAKTAANYIVPGAPMFMDQMVNPTSNAATNIASFGPQAGEVARDAATNAGGIASQTPQILSGVPTGVDQYNHAQSLVGNPIGSSMSLAQIGTPDPNVFSAEKMGLKFAQPTDSAHASPLASPSSASPLSPESVGLQSISSQDVNNGQGATAAPTSSWGEGLGKVGAALTKAGVGVGAQGQGNRSQGPGMAPSPGGSAPPGNLAAELFAMLAKNAQQERGFAPVGSFTK